MKVVIDTNVLVSGTFYSGVPCRIIQAWRENRFQLVISTDIFVEYQRVMGVLAMVHPSVEISTVLNYIAENAVIFEVPLLAQKVCEDRDDDKFLACALASGSKLIVSGDKHLLKVSGYQRIKVVKPREFVERYL